MGPDLWEDHYGKVKSLKSNGKYCHPAATADLWPDLVTSHQSGAAAVVGFYPQHASSVPCRCASGAGDPDMQQLVCCWLHAPGGRQPG